MAGDWVRVRRVGTPRMSKTAAPTDRNININFEVAPKPPEKWISLFHEEVGAGRELAGQISTSKPASGANYSGYVSSTKAGIATAVAKLDEIIDDTNDRFEAFQLDATKAAAANRERAEADRKRRIEEQDELDALAEQFSKPPLPSE